MASHAINENSLKILNFLLENEGEDFTAQDIADKLGYDNKAQVNGAITGGLIGRNKSRGLVERVAGPVIRDEKGAIKELKYIKVTEAGKAYDHEAAIAQDIAEKTAAKAE